jgi:hypothetical protein
MFWMEALMRLTEPVDWAILGGFSLLTLWAICHRLIQVNAMDNLLTRAVFEGWGIGRFDFGRRILRSI